ncbi:MAG: M23 family metallopeptidase [Lachnospiraceae bacterium]|nr:M23 family metallopeptidase [Lachnospiraceae bacterium]
MNKRNNKRSGLNKEKVSVIAASVFVLSALTLTGVYMAAQNDSNTEENRIDFAQLEQQQNKAETKDNLVADERFTRDEYAELSENNDMDVDPNYMEVNSGEVENDRYSLIMQEDEATQKNEAEIAAQAPVAEVVEDESKVIAETPSFDEGDNLQWPIAGEVLLNYSMDKAIYFSTMQQYRYNPSVVIAAKEGDTVTAAADATVKKIYHDVQTGNTVLFDLGDGYELTYGQLTDITLEEGQQVKAGDVVGKVAEPTIFYSVEGSNVYFKMTKDGEPVNPLELVE